MRSIINMLKLTDKEGSFSQVMLLSFNDRSN
jgi:hypothetical protein